LWNEYRRRDKECTKSRNGISLGQLADLAIRYSIYRNCYHRTCRGISRFNLAGSYCVIRDVAISKWMTKYKIREVLNFTLLYLMLVFMND
jgi:hypothetical protein